MKDLLEKLGINLKLLLLFGALASLAGCSTPTFAPVDSRSSAPKYRPALYKVRSGDTLFSIAFQHGLDYRKVAKWNRIHSPYTIYVGQKIHLRPGRAVASKQARGSRKKAVKSNNRATRTAKKARKNKASSSRNRTNTASRLKWRWPANGRIVERFSTKQTGQKGIDIAGKSGQTIKAAESGKVVYAGGGLLGYGKLIIIKHNDAFLSAYAHNRRLLVKEGQVVKSGQRIAEMGKSGTDSVKLHFEIRRNGQPVNPQRYLPG